MTNKPLKRPLNTLKTDFNTTNTMSNIDFEPKTEIYTAIYDAKGNEICRLEGAIMVNPKDYEEFLPIEYRHVKVVTTLLNVVRVDKKKSSQDDKEQ